MTGGLKNQLNHLATTCGKLADFLSCTPDINEAKASPTDDRALNVMNHDVTEDKSSSIWRDELAKVLRTSAGKDVSFEDTFRHQATPDNCLCIVQLHSVIDRRLVDHVKLTTMRYSSVAFTFQVTSCWKNIVVQLKRRDVRGERSRRCLVMDSIALFSVKDGFVKQLSAGRSGSSSSYSLQWRMVVYKRKSLV